MQIINTFFILLVNIAYFNFAQAQIINFSKFSIGETRIKLDLLDFEIKHENKNVKVQFSQDSIQWVRNEKNLLTPRALLAIGVDGNTPTISINYLENKVIPVKRTNYFFTELFIDLFNPGEIRIFDGNKKIDTIIVEAHSTKDAKSKQLIDYSCNQFNLAIDGVDSEYLSAGCKLERMGKIFNETPRLEVSISSTNLKTLSGNRPPFTIFMKDSTPAEFQVQNSKNEIQTIKVNASLPKKLSRLKTAFGLGPYAYQSFDTAIEAKSEFAPSVMIYGKLDLTESSSIKGFDALLYAKSLFNNSGVYFSYDLAEILDGRVLINTLLGFQGLHYRYKRGASTEFRILYPQGFEVIYKHAFGIKSKNLTYGMFLSTSNTEPYTNAWIRYGGKVFYELNYINWSFGTKKISMAGFSVGFPFFEAF